MSNIIVIAEVRGGSLKRPSLEAVTAAQQLAKGSGGHVIVVACGHGLETAAGELAASGANKVVTVEGAASNTTRATPTRRRSPSKFRATTARPC